jgi:predicted phage terminase large subunit-like protein
MSSIEDEIRSRFRILRAGTNVENLAQEIGLRPLPAHAMRIYKLIRKAQAEGTRIQVLAAPGCLKSTVIGLCIIQDLLLEDDPHILFGSRSDKVVESTGNFIRAALRPFYGEEIEQCIKSLDGFKWEAKVFCVPGWKPSSKFPSFAGATQGTAIEGLRANRAYVDDAVDRESLTSEAYRRQARTWMDYTFLDRLDKDAPLAIIGSLWHPDDFYMTNMGQGYETHIFPFGRKVRPEIFKAFEKAEWHGEEYEYLWPEQWDGVDLQALARDKGGHIAFGIRYMCDPAALEGTRFKPNWFRYYDLPLPNDIHARLNIVAGMDPAVGKSDIGDLSAITVLGYDSVENRYYVLECIAGHWNPVERKNEVIKVGDRHQCKIYIEDVGFTHDFIEQLKRDTDLRIYGQEPGSHDKVTRIDSLAVPIEEGRIWFNQSQQDLVQELLYFPSAGHDDRADSLEIAYRSLRKSRRNFMRAGFLR